jgi:DNA-binding CsgD family transcriptional regulator
MPLTAAARDRRPAPGRDRRPAEPAEPGVMAAVEAPGETASSRQGAPFGQAAPPSGGSPPGAAAGSAGTGFPAPIGRHQERAVLERLIAGARAGRAGALVVAGEAGIGKSTLLEQAAAGAGAGLRVLRAVGVESEMELAFAAAHQLCAPLLEHAERLAPPQREALEVAFGLVRGRAPDRFLVGLALLSLLAEAAEERPLLCLLDDAQWLDQASAEALAFVARRLLAERVALVFALREPERARASLSGLAELRVGPLTDEQARRLLGRALAGPLEARVRDRLVGEGQGNPLALLELGGGLSAAERAGRARLPEPLPLGGRLGQSFLRWLSGLARPVRELLLLLAAAEPAGEPALIWRAAARLGLGAEAAAAAEAQGLVVLGPQLRFRHPLIRSAIYAGASLPERRRVHQALAEACDPQLDPDRRAWHRAQAALGPDEQVAQELERAAQRARQRSGHAAQAALLERAAELSPEPGRRAERALAAAAAELAGGRAQAAAALLAGAAGAIESPLGRARALWLSGAVERALGGEGAPARLLRAALALGPLDAEGAQRAALEALEAALWSGRGPELSEIARQAAPLAGGAGAPAQLLAGLCALYGGRPQAAPAPLRRALAALLEGDEPTLFGLALLAAAELWEERALQALVRRFGERARAEAAPAALVESQLARAGHTELHQGRLGAAEQALSEARELAAAAARPELLAAARPLELLLACWRGREPQARALPQPAAAGQGSGAGSEAHSQGALALLELGLGRYQEALEAAQQACPPDPAPLVARALPQLVEAALRAGQPQLAQAACARLCERAEAAGGDWALGIAARCRALVAGADEAEARYQEAIERLGRTQAAPERARAHLLYGEWLRRQRRRRQAREELRAAHELFAAIGAEAFCERARRELAATGERARRARPEQPSPLTAQEAAIARLVREGASNPEIAARLFISRRTVEYHLSKVFTKLGVSSRTQLARVAIEV